MNVCIQYARPTSGQSEGEIFGLDVAVTNFLTAYFRYGTSEQFLCRPADMPSFDHFKTLATAAGHDAESKCIGLDPRHPNLNLQSVTNLFRPDPLIADLIWRRQQVEGKGYATCGLVHTMSGDRIARAVGELCIAPSDGTDALICPSEAVRDAVHNLWEIQSDYFNHRFGGKFKCPVQTPVIPLGIDTQKFARITGADKRASQRASLGIAADEIVVLFHGRLSFATKAHPLPLFLAMEKAAQQTKRKLRLVMFGYFKPQDMEPLFHSLATDICKSLRVDFIMNDDPRFSEGLWAAADIFTSLVENIQESFGLTPVEAMACGLPAVITDWDGYRGSVRDGIDGYLIPTIAPPAVTGMAIAERYYNHGNYGISLMGAAQSTAVDISRAAEAIAALANDDAKRAAFGTSGRERASNTFDWNPIIKRYEDLWSDQAKLRESLRHPSMLPPAWQAMHIDFPNPWKMFESFPTRTLLDTDRIRIVMDKNEVEGILKHDMNLSIPELILPHTMLLELIGAIRNAEGPMVRDILIPFPKTEHDRLWRCIGWMLKHGVAVIP